MKTRAGRRKPKPKKEPFPRGKDAACWRLHEQRAVAAVADDDLRTRLAHLLAK